MGEERQEIFGDSPWLDHYSYVPAMRVGRMVWLAGTTGTDDHGKITAPGDIAEQTRQIFRKFEKLLNAVGGSCNDIVETTDYFTTTENYRATSAVRKEFFTTARPASAGVLVAGLLRPHALIEIKAVAVLRNDPP